MKLPKFIETHFGRVKIKRKPMKVNHGLFQSSKMEITVATNSPDSIQLNTFIHEILHVCFMNLPEGAKMNEEEAVAFLERPLTDILRRNGWLRLK